MRNVQIWQIIDEWLAFFQPLSSLIKNTNMWTISTVPPSWEPFKSLVKLDEMTTKYFIAEQTSGMELFNGIITQPFFRVLILLSVKQNLSKK